MSEEHETLDNVRGFLAKSISTRAIDIDDLIEEDITMPLPISQVRRARSVLEKKVSFDCCRIVMKLFNSLCSL